MSELKPLVGPTLFTCPICKSEFYNEEQAQYCIDMHKAVDNKLKTEFIKYKQGDAPFPRGIWLSNEFKEAEFYISMTELRARQKRTFANHVK